MWTSFSGLKVVVAGDTYDERAAAFISELRLKAEADLPADQARELVADIADYLSVAAQTEAQESYDSIFARLGSPEALVREARGPPVERRGRPGRIARIRAARTPEPEIIALALLYLACVGLAFNVTLPDLEYYVGGAPMMGVLALTSPILLIGGAWLLCLSRRLTSIEKVIGTLSPVVTWVVLSLVAPHLAGRNETCSSGSADVDGKLVNSYSYCLNGPNWVTNLVEWVGQLAPLLVMVTLATVVVRRNRRAGSASPEASLLTSA